MRTRYLLLKGVIGYVTNGSFLDSQSTDGLRKCWHEEFNYIYIFNLRGDQRTLGEESRREGGKIFGSGSRTPIAITLLIKDGSDCHHVFYNDIGDYLSRQQKLDIIKKAQSITNIEWIEIIPDQNNDWINQRDKNYESYPSIEGDYFHKRAIGVSTNRDAWVYGFNKSAVKENSLRMADNFNSEIYRLSSITDKQEKLKARNLNGSFIKWSTGLNNLLVKGTEISLDTKQIVTSLYRPFTKKWLFYDKQVIERPGRFKEFKLEENKCIYITGNGASRGFSAIVAENIPNLHLQDSGQAFFKLIKEDTLFGGAHSNISEKICKKMNATPSEVFNYVYGILNSKEYKEKYANDLSKALPRIPIIKASEKVIEIGGKLVDLHLNYENIPPYNGLEILIKDNPSYKVNKMKHPKKDRKDIIIFNSDITITGIPEKTYEYIVNGKPAIQWVMEQYQVKADKVTGIVGDPNLYSEDEKYIFNLLLSIITVSIKTVNLVNSLPPLELIEDE